MSVEIPLHGRSVSSIFELLGTKENDITYSLGWAFAQSECLRARFLGELFPKDSKVEVASVSLQEHIPSSGKTDIELRGPKHHVINPSPPGPTAGRRRY